MSEAKYTVCSSSSYSLNECAVSVIIPIYNVENYIIECVESIAMQTFKNIEIVCVDDGSSDASFSLVKEYAKNDSRFTLIEQTNQGVSAARNHGIAQAKGKYLYCMDSDDVLELHAIEELYKKAEENDLDVVYFDASCFGNKTEVRKNKNYYIRKYDYFENITGIQMLGLQMKNDEFRVSPCLQFIKKAIIDENHITYHEGVIHEDNAFALLTMICAKRVSHVKQQYFKRRYRDSSIMTQKKLFRHAYGYYIASIDVLEKYSQYIDASNNECKPIHVFINQLMNSARNIYATLDEVEKNKYLELPLEQQLSFELYVVKPAEIKAKLVKAETKFYHKLKVYQNLKNQLSKETITKIKKMIRK